MDVQKGLLGGSLDGQQHDMESARIYRGPDMKSRTKINISGAGVLSVNSSDIIQTGKMDKQLKALHRIEEKLKRRSEAKKAEGELNQLEQFLGNWYDNKDYSCADINHHMQLALRRIDHLKKLLSNCTEE